MRPHIKIADAVRFKWERGLGYLWICSDGVHHALGRCPRSAFIRWRLQARRWENDPQFAGRLLDPREYLVARGVLLQ